MGLNPAPLGKTRSATLKTGKGSGGKSSLNPRAPLRKTGTRTSKKAAATKSLKQGGKKIRKKATLSAQQKFAQKLKTLRAKRAKAAAAASKIVGMEIESGNPVPYLTHNEMNDIARKIGVEMANRPIQAKNKFVIPIPDGYKDGKISKYLSASKDPSDDQYDAMYRNLYKKKDEPASTSLMRCVSKGIRSVKITDPALLAEMTQVLENISRPRFDTVEVGVSTGTYTMQHPCPPGGGLFGDSTKTMSNHNDLDRYRKNYVLMKAADHMTDPDWDAYSMAKVIITSAITFTLNTMSAPITASDIHPHSNMSAVKIDDPVMQKYNQRRQDMKMLAKSLGVTIEVDGETDPKKMLERAYAARQTDMLDGLKTGKTIRSLSPARI